MSNNFSGFLSNFSGTATPNIDIIKNTSPQIGPLTTSLNGGGSYYGRYFCLGDLLIQFSDFSSGISPGSSTQNTFYMEYPLQYDSTPYCVILNSVKQENQNFPCNLTLISFTAIKFTFNISSDNGEVSFLVIGPRPTALYT